MKILAVLFVAVTLAILFAIPANVTLNVGDDGTRVREVGMYGYGKSIFNLAPSRDDDGERLSPSAFSIGGWLAPTSNTQRPNTFDDAFSTRTACPQYLWGMARSK